MVRTIRAIYEQACRLLRGCDTQQPVTPPPALPADTMIYIQKKTKIPSGWTVIGCSVKGPSHAVLQDRYAYRALPGGILGIAVADGLGSAAHAEDGAHIAVETPLNWLEGHFREHRPPVDETGWRSLLYSAVQIARDAIRTYASTHGYRFSELGTTLCLVLANNKWLAAAQIGDGAIIAGDPKSGFEIMLHPPEAEYANQTSTLTSEWEPEILIRVQPRSGKGIAVATDGVTAFSVVKKERRPYEGFFAPLFSQMDGKLRNPDEVSQMLGNYFASNPAILSKTDDDKTLVMAWKGKKKK